MPEWLTRKVGPLPVWGYGVLGLGVILVLRARAKSAAGTTTTPGVSTNYSATVPNVPTESVTTPSGFSYSGPAGGAQYYIPQGAMAATSGSSFTATPTTGETLISSGYGNPAGVGADQAITSGTGAQYTYIQSPTQLQGILSSGLPVYYQPTPGNFVATNPSSLPQAPLYLQSQAAPA